MGKRILTENDIDLTYNLESENAQSGIALAPMFQKKIELWQPNTEYKVGDVILANAEEGNTDVTVGMICIQNHTAGDVDYPSDMENFYDSWVIFPLRSLESKRAVEDAQSNVIHETYATKEDVGNIETALDNIIALQENLIGGGSV